MGEILEFPQIRTGFVYRIREDDTGRQRHTLIRVSLSHKEVPDYRYERKLSGGTEANEPYMGTPNVSQESNPLNRMIVTTPYRHKHHFYKIDGTPHDTISMPYPGSHSTVGYDHFSSRPSTDSVTLSRNENKGRPWRIFPPTDPYTSANLSYTKSATETSAFSATAG